MNKELIPHVFSSLHSLERYLNNIKKLLGDKNANLGGELSATQALKDALPQQETIVKNMRRVANKLQLQIAGGDSEEAVRSLRIFYGLNHMVRPELIAAFVLLSRADGEAVEPIVAAEELALHIH